MIKLRPKSPHKPEIFKSDATHFQWETGVSDLVSRSLCLNSPWHLHKWIGLLQFQHLLASPIVSL